MTAKKMSMMVAVALGLMGSVFADGPKADVEARHQAELRKAWQQGFEQGYQRANALRDNQQLQQRKQAMERRRKMIEKFVKARGPKAAPAEGKCPKAGCGDRPNAPKADRADRPRGSKAMRGDRPRGPKAARGDRPRAPKAEAR